MRVRGGFFDSSFSSFVTSLLLLAGVVLVPCSRLGAQQPGAQREAPATSPEERAALHNGPDWRMIVAHLPNSDTGSAAELEMAGDVLKARRFPEDALDYYGYAMARGGNVSRLLNKMGVVRLELRQNALAHEMFQRTVHVEKKNAQAWNNLGVTEYVVKNYGAAISDYKHASKLDKRSAVYHSNLGMAYFEQRDMSSARQQFAIAVKLDPAILQSRDGNGATAHVMGSQNYSELCFEMARMYAREHKAEAMRLWLARASEGGFDVKHGMSEDAVLVAYLKDPQIKVMLANALQMRAKVASPAVPSLGAEKTVD